MLKNKIAVVLLGTALLAGATVAAQAASSGPNPPVPSPFAVGPVPASGMPITAQVRFVGINANGTIDPTRNLGAVAASHVGTGLYTVTFGSNIRGCDYLGTIALASNVGISPPGFITTVGASASVNAVFVTTSNTAGAAADLGFHLAVTC